MDSHTLWELAKEKTYDEKERIVTYFMWYVFNVWNIAESKAVFGYQLGTYVYKKYVEYVFDNRMDVLRWYSELDTDCKTKLVNRAYEVYNNK